MESNETINQAAGKKTGGNVNVSRDLLLGYLLHSLEETETSRIEREIRQEPFLLEELAAIERDLAPLRSISATIKPPAHLASRTCAKIWDTLDKQDKKPLAAEPAPPLRLYTETNVSRRKLKGWAGFFASAALGMFIAFMIFPLLKFVKHSTVNYVRENQLNAINQRLDPYEQINAHKPAAAAPETPLNLGQFAWKELYPVKEEGTMKGVLPDERENTMETIMPVSSLFTLHSSPNFPSSLFTLPYSVDTPVSYKQRNVSDDILISTPQGIQTGTGQNVLIKDGRIFFRDLPR
ncbi:MAG: hypothetical protein LBT89_09265 [Planctomycetaceae bacterium]|jgi:hypothetical protein|nr:hypothetical protein [Planctomycetaceae bacterium]